MKDLFLAVILFVAVLWGNLITWGNQEEIKEKLSLSSEPPLEFQSIYVTTVDGFDIIHICGTHVFTESGLIDICFPARNQALAFVEQLSADIVNGYKIE